MISAASLARPRLAPARRPGGAARPRPAQAPRALTPETGALVAAVGILGVVNQWMAIEVVKARKRFNVPYPQMYAEGASEAAYSFNSVQRAHQNGVEAYPIVLAVTAAVAAARGPRDAAILLAVWTAGRVAYFLGYSKTGPSGRMAGALVSNLSQLVATLAVTVWGLRAALGV